MFEVKFENEKLNIGNDVKKYNKKKQKTSENNVFIAFGAIIATAACGIYGSLTGVDLITISRFLGVGVCSTGGVIILSNFVNFISNCIINKNKKISKEKLNEVVDVLSQNKINTTTKEIANSVVIENSYKEDHEVVLDGKTTRTGQQITDKYFLFFDNDSKIQGILEKDIITTEDLDSKIEKQFYILENSDIEQFSSKISKINTKKLVRKK